MTISAALNGIRKLALFGSVLSDRFSPSSDIDILAEFRLSESVGFFRLAEMEQELSKLFAGRKIDLRTPTDLSRYFRDEVVRNALNRLCRTLIRSASATGGRLAAAALEMATGYQRPDLDSNRMLALAPTRSLEILGEAAAQVSSEVRMRFPVIPFASMVGMRNRLIHAYFDVDLNIVWTTVTEDLPPLLPALGAALANLEP